MRLIAILLAMLLFALCEPAEGSVPAPRTPPARALHPPQAQSPQAAALAGGQGLG